MVRPRLMNGMLIQAMHLSVLASSQFSIFERFMADLLESLPWCPARFKGDHEARSDSGGEFEQGLPRTDTPKGVMFLFF